MTEIHLLLWWVRSRMQRAAREHADEPSQVGASVVEWVLICVLAAALAAILGAALIRMVVTTANAVRTR